MLKIRPATIHDMPALYRICLRTALNGADASEYYADPDLVGHVFAGPYLTGDTAFGFVAADDDGVAGYILGAADSPSFERWAERAWWPDLRNRYPSPARDARTGTGSDTAASTAEAHDARLIRLLHAPPTADPQQTGDYPAHLHIDLLPRAQGSGAGRRLIDAFTGELASRGVAGVHLGVSAANPHAVGFYRHLGFRTLREDPETLLLGLPVNGVGTGR
ncbi:GNAT family N-acetyltransferase [Spelaeicoccus albus]|uniref:Ribosomal protein S18 acetylase RimI-like enzyme n=1 Tax=Spelaeicoccus albus TaxID=1280376 RepID=A0A7Z0D3T9_9MICO|nr:GNAT family N-acetyltransferase [Spelaeicoccus albus]NYI68364.1 ribosomal protein S18 acetylase RimI-like enzyme [Spelaeicoccus albus]